MTRTSTLVIRTPEGVEFRLPLAGPFSRMLALAIDLAVAAVFSQVLIQALAPLGVLGPDTMQAASVIAYFVISLAYGSLAEWFWRGQTVGKRLLGLRVMEASGLRLTPAQVIVRNLMRFADALPGFYLVGGVACVLNSKYQRLGDVVAGTIVVRNSQWTLPVLNQPLGEKFNSLATPRHLAARLRQRVTPEVAKLAFAAMLRRDEIEPRARLKLFGELANHFRSLVPYPVEATEQLADEQYVRNVIEILMVRR